MVRVKFKKNMQREFLKEILEILACPSLRELQNRIVGVSYSSLKNYFSERRNLSQDLFLDLCDLIKKDFKSFNVIFLEDNFGQIKGGKKSKRK